MSEANKVYKEDFGWFAVDVTYSPTALDPEGCDGLYVKDVRVKWWGWPIALFHLLFPIFDSRILEILAKMMRK